MPALYSGSKSCITEVYNPCPINTFHPSDLYYLSYNPFYSASILVRYLLRKSRGIFWTLEPFVNGHVGQHTVNLCLPWTVLFNTKWFLGPASLLTTGTHAMQMDGELSIPSL